MLDVGIFNILFDTTFLVTMVAGILAFATIVTLGLPMLERNSSATAHESGVASGARNCAQRHHAALNAKRGTLRSRARVSFMKATVERFKLSQHAGIRRHRATSWRRPAIAARRRSSPSCSSAS